MGRRQQSPVLRANCSVRTPETKYALRRILFSEPPRANAGRSFHVQSVRRDR
jgi:hypothetical protein